MKKLVDQENKQFSSPTSIDAPVKRVEVPTEIEDEAIQSLASSQDIITEEESKELFQMLQSSEEQIANLRQQLQELDKQHAAQNNAIAKERQNEDLQRRRLENEVTDLRQKLELETTTKMALQSNNKELDKEIQRLHRLLQVRSGGGPPWVPDWFVDACTGCKLSFTFIRRRVRN
jgi:hypothetical protein